MRTLLSGYTVCMRGPHVRTYAIIGALFLGLVISTMWSVRTATVSQLGSSLVSMTVGIKPNSYNTLAQKLSEKEEELKRREASIVERETKLSPARTLLPWALTGGLFVALIFVVIWHFRRVS